MAKRKTKKKAAPAADELFDDEVARLEKQWIGITVKVASFHSTGGKLYCGGTTVLPAAEANEAVKRGLADYA